MSIRNLFSLSEKMMDDFRRIMNGIKSSNFALMKGKMAEERNL